ELTVRSPATVLDVVRQARAVLPGAERIAERPLAALNQTHVRLDAPVSHGDELALLPPLAGG
ncbi:MAG: MoaD/ThiS family protein, partial [Gemmatimonadales bacterium]